MILKVHTHFTKSQGQSLVSPILK